MRRSHGGIGLSCLRAVSRELQETGSSPKRRNRSRAAGLPEAAEARRANRLVFALTNATRRPLGE
jgi:hypothetical protein